MNRRRLGTVGAGVLGLLACANAFQGAPASLFRASLLAPAGAQRVRVGLSRGGASWLRAAKQSLQMSGDLPVCVILPGFGNAAVDYSNPFGADFKTSISYALEKRGFEVRVMPLMRSQWFNVLWGLFDLSFWLSTVTPYERSYGWYVQMARDIIAEAGAKGTGVIVIGHSAGGWLGRAALGDGTNFNADIRAFVSLGAPHSPPPEGIPGVMDMTRGALTWTDKNLPGAFLAEKGVHYVTVASDLIKGSEFAENGTPAKAAYNSYRLVCGAGDVPGDGVVPLQSAHLPEAAQITMQVSAFGWLVLS